MTSGNANNLPTARAVNEPGRVWPTGTDYSRAVQTPQVSFSEPDLAAGRPGLNMLGMPLVASGQNAVVFLLEAGSGRHAVRCFLTPPSEGAIRYSSLERHLAGRAPRGLTAARWLQTGITVDGTPWPVVVMPWVEGKPLNIAVEDILEDGEPHRLVAMANQWSEIVVGLQAANLAHGDLQHGNVLVRPDGAIALVDLDGVWVPEITIGPPAEYGHPNYQHPQRTTQHWGQFVDSFPGALIELALRALAADPSLERFMNGENLLFSRSDLERPQDAPVWAALCASPSPDVASVATMLRSLCAGPIANVLCPYRQLLSGEAGGATVQRPSLSPPSALLAPSPTMEAVQAPAAGNWWEQPAAPLASVLSTPSGGVIDGGPAVVVASQAGAAASTHGGVPAMARSAQPSDEAGAMAIGRTTTVAGLVGGALAGALGSVLTTSVDLMLSERMETVAFVMFISLLLGGFLLSFQSIAAGNWAAAFRRFAVGAGVGCLAGLVALVPADLALRAVSSEPGCVAVDGVAPDGCVPIEECPTEDAAPISAAPDAVCAEDFSRVPAIANSLVFAIVAGAVGLALGLLRSRTTGMWCLGAGVVGGAVGGALFGATVADYTGLQLDVYFLRPLTVLIVAIVCATIGVAFGAMVRARRLASLTIIEGRNSGMEIAVEGQKATIGSHARCDMVLRGDASVLPTHAELSFTAGPPLLTAHGDVRLNGGPVVHQGTVVRDGDVLKVGGSYIRVELKAGA